MSADILNTLDNFREWRSHSELVKERAPLTETLIKY